MMSDDDAFSQSMQLAAERLAAKRPLEAAEICRKSLTRFPDDAKMHYLLAIALTEAQQPDEAIDAYNRAVSLKPDFFQAHTNLGILLSKRGRLDEAIGALSQAIRLRPDMAETHVNLSNALRENGKLDEARAVANRALVLNPDSADAHYSLGAALQIPGRFDDAIRAYSHAVRLKPDFFQAHTNLGILLVKGGRLDEATEAFSQAIRVRPDLAVTHLNMSNALRESWKLDEAVAAANKAVALNPDLAEAHQSLGVALQLLGQFDDAIGASNKAIQLKPESASAHLNLALAELVLGNLDRGWPEYEWRRRCPDILPPRDFPQPMWDGNRIEGKTILLYCEQGFGDGIHFVRYAPLVAGMGGRVILECPAPLLRLFQGYPGVERVVPAGKPLPNFDVQCALPSLPGLFKTTLQSIPAPIPYLTADAAAAQSWRGRMKPSPDVRQIGLAWTGRPSNLNDRNRSIGLERFSPLGSQHGVRFHNLLPIRPANALFPMSDWSELLKDFADTAALIANLDLIISVDTAVAHLAGAMGKPVWLLLPFPPDWRWMLDRTDSPWYPTVKLFRQQKPGDWDTVIRRVADALRTTSH